MASSARVFSFSLAELVFDLNPPLPSTHSTNPTHPGKVLKWSNSARFMKAKLINLLSRPNINKLITLTFNFKNQLPTSTTTLENFSSLNVSKLKGRPVSLGIDPYYLSAAQYLPIFISLSLENAPQYLHPLYS